MNISLTPQLEAWVQEKVASGRYSSASEVVREALRMFQERDEDRQRKLEELRKDLQVGIDQLERGEYIELTEEELPEFFEGILEEAKRRLANGDPPDA